MIRAAAVLLMIGVVACGARSRPPPSLMHADASLSFQSETQGHVLFDATLPIQNSGPEYFTVAGGVVRKIARAVQDRARDTPKDFASADVVFLVPDQDRLGNRSAHTFLAANFSASELRTARLDNLSDADILNLGSDVDIPIEHLPDAAAWCSYHAEPDFCGVALKEGG